MCDVGANLVVEPEDLVAYARMTKIFCEEILNVKNPRMSLLNIGTEENKGFEYLIEANKQLKADANFNYLGFIEPKTLVEGGNDIILCDGYTGNMVLKTLEGTMKSMGKEIKKQFTKP
jgi:glycerol-3-phosphate acyltransferase PlsX